jgi:hypothetical protein
MHSEFEVAGKARRSPMCISCGCRNPRDDHGDERNITIEDLERAAEAAGITLDAAALNVADGPASAAASVSSRKRRGSAAR